MNYLKGSVDECLVAGNRCVDHPDCSAEAGRLWNHPRLVGRSSATAASAATSLRGLRRCTCCNRKHHKKRKRCCRHVNVAAPPQAVLNRLKEPVIIIGQILKTEKHIFGTNSNGHQEVHRRGCQEECEAFFSNVKNPVGEGEVIGEDDWSITRASGVAGKKCRDWEGGLAGILCA